ncbi:MAG: tail fiber domain-containing protein [Patescibacteria group bacterium]
MKKILSTFVIFLVVATPGIVQAQLMPISGGTGSVTKPSNGDILYGSSNVYNQLHIGSSGGFLTTNGSAPAWGNSVSYISTTDTTSTSTFAGQIFSGNNFTANSNRVKVAPYGIATTSSNQNWGVNSGETSFECITTIHDWRIRQNGTWERVGMNNVNKTGLTGFYAEAWRINSNGTFDLVGRSENIVSSITAGGLSTTTFATPIVGVREGDYPGYLLTYTSATNKNFTASTTASSGGSYCVTNGSPTQQGYNWFGQSYTDKMGLVLEAYMQAPIFVTISDSILAGHGGTTVGSITYPDNYSFIESTDSTFTRGTVAYMLGNRTGWSYQNMGIGGQGTPHVVARFTSDVVNLYPKFVVIEIGSNSVSTLSAATIAADWQTMINSATANGIKVVGVLIPPRIALSNTAMQTRDAANSLISTEVLASGGIVVNVDPYVGKYRSGGDAGNLWDQRSEYLPPGGDTSHYNMFGYDRFTDAIIDALNGAHTIKGKIDASGVTVGGSITFAPNIPHVIEISRNTTLAAFHADLDFRAGGAMASTSDSSGGAINIHGGVSTGMGSSTVMTLWGSQAATSSAITDNSEYPIMTVDPTGLKINNNVDYLANATSTFQQCFSKSTSFNGDCFQIVSWTTNGTQNRVSTLMGPIFTGDSSATAGIYVEGSTGNVGNIGIGSTTAPQRLTVTAQDASASSINFPVSIAHTLTSGTPAVGMGEGILFKNVRSTGAMTVQGYLGTVWQNSGSETADMIFAPVTAGSGNGTERMRLSGVTGTLGLGTTSPASAYSIAMTKGAYIGGTIYATSTVFFPGLTNSNTGDYLCWNTTTFEVEQNSLACSLSSIKYKENIRELNYGLNEVLQMHPVLYDKKPQYGTDKNRPGFIAEEAVKVVPFLVPLNKEGKPDNFDYVQYTAVLTKAIQELNSKFFTSQRSVEENWQWIVVGILTIGMAFQQSQIRKLKK